MHYLSIMATPTRSRYSEEQLDMLVSLVEKSWDVLDGPLGVTPLHTSANRDKIWSNIANKVSAVGPSPWSAEKIQVGSKDSLELFESRLYIRLYLVYHVQLPAKPNGLREWSKLSLFKSEYFPG
ncbi:unnamed protein product [Owenia fusiformis]|uniref:Myb/SANT-like DNA-binding domain-containing protein n=1 Tax=Owenia fusiformis TaxID=6347 RepID=A0A8S4N2K6_OWEFU|nr:unnamed protein product [Owenia fusiformis]